MRRCFILILFFLPFFASAECENCAITYTFAGGRFGDHMLCYLHAKWISYKHGIPLLFVPFDYSKNFLMHYQENYLEKSKFAYNEKKVQDPYEFDFALPKDTLFIIPYYPESKEDLKHKIYSFSIPVDWKDPEFKKIIQLALSPAKKFNLLYPAKNRIAVAIHIRSGKGIDKPDSYKIWPQKFPPLSYYIEQLKFLNDKLGCQPLYVFVFSDDPNPSALADALDNGLGRPANIEWGYRKKNGPEKNVMEDFFSMLEYEYLIRPDSNFSFVVEKIGNFKLSISPAHHIWKDGKLIIDRVRIDTP